MRRREFMTLLGAVAAALWGREAGAQQIPAIGFLHAGSADGYAKEVAGFKQGLRETGYVEGQNVAIEYRWADGHYEQLSDLAADLVRKRVAVIVAAPISAAIVAKDATKAIPIVFEHGADPVRFGLVASLNRPGGNITGIVNLSNTLVTKRIELMHQLVPNATSIALLVDPGVATSEAVVGDAKKAETLLGIKLKCLRLARFRKSKQPFLELLNCKRARSLLASAQSLIATHNKLPSLLVAIVYRLVMKLASSPGLVGCSAMAPISPMLIV
jgi:putative tryptophan/tyrosine transport system substrate-binding protein